MLQFTTPQSGDPEKNKSAIAYQVRRHAAKVAAARQRKIRGSPLAAGTDGGASPPIESCFLLGLDGDTEKSRHNSASIVKATKSVAGSGGPATTRPKWTSVYKLNTSRSRATSSNSTPKTTPIQTPSPFSTESPIPDIELRTGDDAESAFDYANALPWPDSLHSFLETALDPPQIASNSDAFAGHENTSYQSLLTLGKHIPDSQASMLAFEMGSGFRAIHALPAFLRQAQRRAVGATVALDQYQRGSPGAPFLEDIVGEAEQSYMAFRAAETASSLNITSDGLVADCCRLAGLIYCELVLFPSLSEDDTLPELVSELQTALETAGFWLSEEENTVPVSYMLIWATMMGAMIHTGTRNNGWFISRLSGVIAADESLRDWQVMRSLLSKYLWWHPVCDRPGQTIWTEALRLAPPKVAERPIIARMT
ncbi:hypothetical protein H2200_000539 [Cladophialophora chaetospira]|uniref:Uncharacterized protein n=1 Tax=Cladophialophora chaetospira TaxID=386627 RepID=A0AA38XNM2_9EURO|nr:hypothetical protein H2200_000539 [Cladophialophora chaetospira]